MLNATSFFDIVQDTHDNVLEVPKRAISEENSGERRYDEDRIALLANQ